jgi:hypothetical protein
VTMGSTGPQDHDANHSVPTVRVQKTRDNVRNRWAGQPVDTPTAPNPITTFKGSELLSAPMESRPSLLSRGNRVRSL